MKRLVGIVAMLMAGGSAAMGFPCPEPQYAFLKDLNKDELRYEYCRLTRKAISNRGSHQSTLQMIEEKKALQLYDPKDRDKSMDELIAAQSCELAARQVAGVLSRRFKSKPPASCT